MKQPQPVPSPFTMKHQHRHRGSIVAAIAVVFLCRHLLYCHGVTIEEGEGAPIQTVQFTPNVTHRTDMCDKQRLFRGGLIEFDDLLRGINL
jgi:hypothetical protein